MASDVRREKRVRAGEITDIGKAKLTDQSILEGAAEPLDPAFRLRRRGGNPLDAKLGEGTADVSGVGAAAELLLQRRWCLFRSDEDAVPICVDGDREPVSGGDLTEEEQVARGVFTLAEDRT